MPTPQPRQGPVTTDGIREIDVETFARFHAAGVSVIDVREPHEYRAAHVPGAQLIPLASVPDRLGEVPSNETVYVICAVGGRSRKAAEFYCRHGVDAVNVGGGTVAWIEANQPTEMGMEP